MGQLSLKTLVGGLAGLAIWAILEPSAPGLGQGWGAWEMMFVLALGAGIGLAVGALNGWIQGSKIHLLRGAGFGLLFGAIGIMLGYQLGSTVSSALFGNAVLIDPTASIATKTIARVIALTPIGIFLGAAIGASSLNWRRTFQGAIGGLIGGALGGGLFDTLGSIVGGMNVALQGGGHGHAVETGSTSRALFAALLGGLIALFIGIVDLISRSAWVRLVLGRNEGKEWPIDAPQVFIGRNEAAAIPLFGDPNVAPMHACITKQGAGQYVISDGGSPVGTLVNGQRIQQAALFNGAQIQIGSFTLQFLMREGAAPVRGPEAFNQAYQIQNPVPGGRPVGPYMGPATPAPTQAMNPAPGSLYGSAPSPVAPAPSGAYPGPSQPTVALPTATPGGFVLTPLDGPLIGQRFPIRGPVELGRESASVPMGYDSGASRRHASVSPGPSGLAVMDLGSTNGTFVNGQRVQSANAGPGDLIKIGATTFRVEPG